MCGNHHDHNKSKLRKGASLKDGKLHSEDHAKWSRRQFLVTGGLATMGSVTLGGMPVSPFAPNAFINALENCNEDRVLVLLRLFGGNDGLNTVIPHSSGVGRDKYEEFRPTLALEMGTDYSANTLLSGFGSTDFALPNVMEDLMPIWHDGKMAVVHNVGYPLQNFSHFTSSNLWATGADNIQDKRYGSGWMGRQLNQSYPSFSETPPTVPPALQIGFTNDLIFKNEMGVSMELVFRNPDEFYRLAQEGKLYSTDGFGDCPRDAERFFLRQMANNSLRYSETVSEAYNRSENKVAYPTGTQNALADQLSIVSRLVKGQLGTKVYMVYINGFDTHAGQKDLHLRLLGDIGTSVRAFYDDLKADGYDKDVTLMTFSEFGRTVVENGSLGTDHGNMSPLFVIGDGVNGGFYGDPMSLYDDDIDRRKRVYFENQPSIDFRTLYGSLFTDWLGVDQDVVRYVLGDDYGMIPNMFSDPCSPATGSNGVGLLLGHNASLESPDKIEIKYALNSPGNMRLQILDLSGQEMATIDQGYKPKGTYTYQLDPKDFNLKQGMYIYKIDAAGQSYGRKLLIQ